MGSKLTNIASRDFILQHKVKGKSKIKKDEQIDFSKMSRAILGGGCFWCIEAVFQRLKGVEKVRSGYAGGKTINPTYHAICTGQTGHAQVCQITYNPMILPYRSLITVFMKIHDPTTLNRQGYDKGTQYRSIVLYQTQQQKKVVNEVIEQVNAQKYYPDKIVTEVRKLDKFYPAEIDHQNYYNENTEAGYCKAVIKPKLGKLAELFKDKVDQRKL